ncbi:MAG: hypothetical protein LBE97_01830, partial [Holosporales bacterium]|nr:hypothetical protein [Holosporales bacterium]
MEKFNKIKAVVCCTLFFNITVKSASPSAALSVAAEPFLRHARALGPRLFRPGGQLTSPVIQDTINVIEALLGDIFNTTSYSFALWAPEMWNLRLIQLVLLTAVLDQNEIEAVRAMTLDQFQAREPHLKTIVTETFNLLYGTPSDSRRFNIAFEDSCRWIKALGLYQALYQTNLRGWIDEHFHGEMLTGNTVALAAGLTVYQDYIDTAKAQHLVPLFPSRQEYAHGRCETVSSFRAYQNEGGLVNTNTPGLERLTSTYRSITGYQAYFKSAVKNLLALTYSQTARNGVITQAMNDFQAAGIGSADRITRGGGSARHFATALARHFGRKISADMGMDFSMDWIDGRDIELIAHPIGEAFNTAILTDSTAQEKFIQTILPQLASRFNMQIACIVSSAFLSKRDDCMLDHCLTAYPVELHCSSSLGAVPEQHYRRLKEANARQRFTGNAIILAHTRDLFRIPNIFFPKYVNLTLT